MPYDLQKYLERLGPNAALKSFAAFARATARESAFGPKGLLSFMHKLPDFVACLKSPTVAPDLSEFIALKARYLEIVEEVFVRERLDGLVFPQMREELPPAGSGLTIKETTVSEINIAGMPAVAMPAGYYASGAPFGLLFVGKLWSEADLLAYAYSYETATRHRRAPALTTR
jgi:Asp-tRNA(Asn)/Glu-tRNA(Gln) amidotransferase A subunit family amidase